MAFGMNRGIIYVIDRKRLTITNYNLFRTLVLRLSGQVIQVCYEMVKSSKICQP